ncbi:MAG: hypothetical protein HYY06_02810 [Deltaproteobacteria bacterium]|nr:hypothetical protein [Deltaproteobacteria bacterium]
MRHLALPALGLLALSCGSGSFGGTPIGGSPCDVVVCAPGHSCVEGVCVQDDACANVGCQVGWVCSRGSCVAPRLDEDGDTFGAGADCDDRDPQIIPGTTRPCANRCGNGVTVCQNGAWSDCTSPEECSCDPPGSARREPCGRCGTANRSCTADGVWARDPGPCDGQGACEPGSEQVEACGDCSTRGRSCGAECLWADWAACERSSQCDPAAGPEVADCTECGTQERSCTGTCLWGTWGLCEGGDDKCDTPMTCSTNGLCA